MPVQQEPSGATGAVAATPRVLQTEYSQQGRLSFLPDIRQPDIRFDIMTGCHLLSGQVCPSVSNSLPFFFVRLLYNSKLRL